ncbi:MAG: flagellar hook capping FlgD N-terminal domain-containing protein [Candidatus Zixiibacteriota bacterium]
MPITGGIDEINALAGTDPSDRIASQNVLGKDDFLRLFVTRLANQDPLEPVKDEQFIAQMAQFSQLEQLQNMNDNLEQSINWSLLLSQTINNTMATSLLGHSVRVNTDTVVLGESGSVPIRYDLAAGAADVVVEISDSSGNLVRVLRQSGANSGANELQWDGTNAARENVAPGAYNVTIRAEDSAGETVEARAYFTGVVDAVRYVDGIAMLAVDDLFIPLADVIEVQQAGE